MSGLAFESIETDAGTGGPTFYILHGFLGSGRNWASFARRLVDLRPDWRAVLVDLRLHGDSRDLPGPHTVAAAADDLAGLVPIAGNPGAPVAVLGHSFGGKVALMATERLDRVPVQTWVIDSTPAAAGQAGAAERMLARLEASPPSFADREAAVAWITGGGFDEATARWMATNLQHDDDGWSWRLHLEGLRELLTDFAAADLWRIVESPPPDGSIHLVRATNGSILAAADAERIRRLAARGEPVTLHELEGGHWLHIDNPGGLLEMIADRLPRLPSRR